MCTSWLMRCKTRINFSFMRGEVVWPVRAKYYELIILGGTYYNVPSISAAMTCNMLREKLGE
jgi:hypothetical protein